MHGHISQGCYSWIYCHTSNVPWDPSWLCISLEKWKSILVNLCWPRNIPHVVMYPLLHDFLIGHSTLWLHIFRLQCRKFCYLIIQCCYVGPWILSILYLKLLINNQYALRSTLNMTKLGEENCHIDQSPTTMEQPNNEGSLTTMLTLIATCSLIYKVQHRNGKHTMFVDYCYELRSVCQINP